MVSVYSMKYDNKSITIISVLFLALLTMTVYCNNKAERGFGLLVRAVKPSETWVVPEVVTHPSTNIAHCCLTSVRRQKLIALCHNSWKWSLEEWASVELGFASLPIILDGITNRNRPNYIKHKWTITEEMLSIVTWLKLQWHYNFAHCPFIFW